MDAERTVKLVSYAGTSPVFERPSDYGLNYEDVTFTAEDGVPLSGWLIPGARSEVIIQTHFGGICSRAGYTPDGGVTAHRGRRRFASSATSNSLSPRAIPSSPTTCATTATVVPIQLESSRVVSAKPMTSLRRCATSPNAPSTPTRRSAC